MKEFNDFSELEEKQIDTKKIFDGEAVMDSTITDGKTQICIMKAANLLK